VRAEAFYAKPFWLVRRMRERHSQHDEQKKKHQQRAPFLPFRFAKTIGLFGHTDYLLEKLSHRDYILFFSFVEQEEDQFDLFDRISSIFLSRRQLFISASRFDASERFG
jgi:hypothetical protein